MPKAPNILARLPSAASTMLNEVISAIDDWKRANSPTSYHTFTVPKRNGKTRTISAPNPTLKAIQKRIATAISNWAVQAGLVGESEFGFIPGRSSIQANQKLFGSRPPRAAGALAQMDLADFFGSIRYGWVWKFARKIGLTKEDAKAFQKITTIDRKGLPQGSPASPILALCTTRTFRVQVEQLARKLDGVGACYADDISIATGDTKSARQALLGMFKRARANGLKPAYDKSAVRNTARGSCTHSLGAVWHPGKGARPSRAIRRRIRWWIHRAIRHDSPDGQVLRGLVTWSNQVRLGIRVQLHRNSLSFY